MDCSYTAVYDSYAKFCNMIGQPVLPFEDWMHAREDYGRPTKIRPKNFYNLPFPTCLCRLALLYSQSNVYKLRVFRGSCGLNSPGSKACRPPKVLYQGLAGV